ncbi:MAG: glucose 1-dehydrogenase [Clostridiales bacterium]|nr:glucose 1-dehydrogenase [Clostridiales bacterium]
MKLQDKVAIVTGASAGMGKAIAQLFAAEGARVIALARRFDRLQALADEAKGKGQSILPLQCDMADEADIGRVVQTALEQFGGIDVLINNAGIMDNMVPLDELEDELWERVISVNLTGPMKLTRSVLREMLKKESGVIVNVASVGGLNGCRAGAAYTTSKFGLVGLTKNIGFAYAKRGIRCNAVCPGGVATEIGEVGISNPSKFGLERAMSGVGSNPGEGQPEDIATAVLFLACDDSRFINGATLVADGGWTAY